MNTDRSVGARISGAIALKYGDSAFEGQLTLNFNGSAGQSFGAFNHEGVSLNLTGESNDYVGKGINGGAGMTGGLGYFLDEDDTFIAKINPEIVKWQRVETADIRELEQDLEAVDNLVCIVQKNEDMASNEREKEKLMLNY